jgi:hypothetical protein
VSTPPAVGFDDEARVHVTVRVDRGVLLSVAHQPVAPTSGWLQIADTSVYVALEVTDLASARRLVELAEELERRLVDTVARELTS